MMQRQDMKLRGVLIALVASLCLFACNKEKAAETNQLLQLSNENLEEIVPKRVVVTPSKLILSEGEVTTLSVNGIYPYGKTATIRENLTWSVADESIVSISETGLAKGLKPGETVMRVEKLGTVTTIDVVIQPAAVTQVIIFPEEPKLSLASQLGEIVPAKVELRAYGLMTNGKLLDIGDEISWQSDDESAISYDSETGLTAKLPGTWKVRAFYGKLEGSKTVTVERDPLVVKSLEVTESNITMLYGNSRSLPVRAIMSDNSIKTDLTGATLTAANSTQISVLSGMNIKATGAGQNSVTVSYGGKSVAVPIFIQEATVSHITYEPDAIALRIGSSQTFVATAHYSDGSSTDITSAMAVSSSNPSVMSVTANSATGLTVGAANLTISYKGKSTSLLVNVGTPVLNKLEIRPDNMTLYAGETATFTIAGIYTDGTEIDMTNTAGVTKTVLSSSLGEVLVPNTVRGKAKGKTKLSVSYIDQITNKNISNSINLTVTDPILQTIIFDPSSSSKPAGRYEDFRVKGQYSDNSEVDITGEVNITADTYSAGMSYAAVLTRTNTGAIRTTGRADGSIRIYAKYGSVIGSAVYTSTPKVLDKVEVIRVQPYTDLGVVSKGSTARLYLEGTYSDGSKENVSNTVAGRTVTWHDPDPTYGTLTVDNDHRIFAAQYQGSANVAVTVNDTTVGILSATLDLGSYVICDASGKQISYYCYYLGVAGDSCTQTCSAIGKNYDPATLAYSGSGHSGDHCSNLITERFTDQVTARFSNSASASDGVGCAIYSSTGITIGLQERTIATTAGAAIADFRRFCACD